jgi:hypothetical protein
MGEDDAIARLHQILAQPEYQVSNAPRPFWEQLLAPLVTAIGDLLVQLVQLIQDSLSGREGWYGSGVLLASVILVALGLGYLVRSVRLAITRETRLRTRDLAERRDRSDELWRTAEQLASAGRLDEAARCVYLSALYALDERALLHVELGLTNREHARRLRAEHPRLDELFSDLVQHYDRVRYGHFDLTSGAFDELRRLGSAAREAALGGATA